MSNMQYDPMKWDNPPPREPEAPPKQFNLPEDDPPPTPAGSAYAVSQLISIIVFGIIFAMLATDTMTIRAMPAFDTSVTSVPPPLWSGTWNRSQIGRIETMDGIVLRLRPGLASRVRIGQRLFHTQGSPFIGIGGSTYLLYHPFLLAGFVLAAIVVFCFWLEIDTVRESVDWLIGIDPTDPVNLSFRFALLAGVFALWLIL
ncbi:MAG TPA: hypothetical protein VIV61_00550 [Candidatus Ozemobacteraceae bacterium]